MTGDEQKFAETDKEWSRNAEDIAAFLSGANPNWPQKDVVDLLNLHLTLTKDEAVARMQQDWEEGRRRIRRDLHRDPDPLRHPFRGDREAVPREVRGVRCQQSLPRRLRAPCGSETRHRSRGAAVC